MSHFITNTKDLQNVPIFNIPSKEVVMPKIKKYIRTKPEDEKLNYRKESKLLSSICQRLQRQEFQQIHKENAREMERKFQKLKHKMRPNMERQSVQKIFNSDIKKEKLNIKQIASMKPQRIQLDKKYGNQILLKMQNFREAEEINGMKEKYRNWYDNEKNGPINSPVFKKMSYLLQRASKQKLMGDISLNTQTKLVRHTISEKQSLDSSFTMPSSRNSSVYKRRQLDWSVKKLKF